MTFIHVVIDPYNNCLDFIYFLRVCKSLCKQERMVKKKKLFFRAENIQAVEKPSNIRIWTKHNRYLVTFYTKMYKEI